MVGTFAAGWSGWLVILACLLPLPHVDNDEPDTRTRPHRLPIGVSDDHRTTGYARNPRDGIDSFDLATGHQFWTTTEAHTPLLVAGDTLVAQADGGGRNRLRVVVLDRLTGKRLLQTEPVILPDWVSVAPAPGYSLTLVPAVRAGELALVWDARLVPTGGAVPPGGRAERREAKGLVTVSLTTGRVTYSTDPGAIAQAAPAIPAPLRSVESAPYLDEGGPSTAPFIVGDHVLAFAQSDKERPSPVSLRRWKLGDPAREDTVALAAKPAYGLVLAPDRRHVFARTSATEERWAAFRLPSGKEAAAVTLPAGAANPVLDSARVYVLVAAGGKPRPGAVIRRFVRAVAAETGETIWEREVAGVRVQPLPK
jgi:hypothetical protein